VSSFWKLSAGYSECPICGKFWLVTPQNDCMMPACGCFGKDFSEANPARPCEDCGKKHMEMHRVEKAADEAIERELIDQRFGGSSKP